MEMVSVFGKYLKLSEFWMENLGVSPTDILHKIVIFTSSMIFWGLPNVR